MNSQSTAAPKKKLHIYLPDVTGPWHKLAIEGLVFLLRQSSKGYAEAKHYMYFPAQQGFTAGTEWQEGNIFQRALIADTLCDCSTTWMTGQLSPIIEEETDYLISQRRHDEVGGWAYFPQLPELPADTDDLAQIMQLLVRTNRTDALKEYCETPLKILLENQLHADGGMESWILPKENLTELQKMQLDWSQNAWGMGADAEVVANMVYALQLYDANRFETVINNSKQFLLNQMDAGGYWESTWYFGNYYGTYVSLRALTQSSNNTDFTPIYNYIVQSRLHDGGWGVDGESDPLQTALALLCLHYIYKSGQQEVNEEYLKKSLDYLNDSKTEDNTWPECQFIKMALGRPHGVITQVLEYGSQTITINFITKAAAHISALLNTENHE